MRFTPTAMPGLIQVDIDRRTDERGDFARTWCDEEAARHGLRTPMVQDSMALNLRKGTLRGMHYHAASFPQARLIRCNAGEAFVAVVDLRPTSPMFLKTFEARLDAVTCSALYVPPGLALGYQTLVDDTVIAYKMPERYDPAHERGLRWNDPSLSIRWPDGHPTLSARDADYPDFDVDAYRGSRLGEPQS
jgi:dTDP-4-dehydrorhamnose 3,5-epimerase